MKPFVWPEDGSLQSVTEYCRYEDMSPDGYLSLIVEEDGDVIVIVQQGDVREFDTFHRATVQFCTMGGGGQSLRVRDALLYLMQTIAEENQQKPQYREKIGR